MKIIEKLSNYFKKTNPNLSLFSQGEIIGHFNGDRHLVIAPPVENRLIGGIAGKPFYEYMDKNGVIWVRDANEVEDSRFFSDAGEPFEVAIDPQTQRRAYAMYEKGEQIFAKLFGSMVSCYVVDLPKKNKLLSNEKCPYYVLRSNDSKDVVYLVPDHVVHALK